MPSLCVMSQLQETGSLLQSPPFQTRTTSFTMALYLYSSIYSVNSSLSEQAGLSNIHHVTSIDPTPKLKIDITALNGTTTTDVLPDSGADISAAGISILSQPLNTLTTFHLPLSFPKLQMEQRCILLAGCRYVSRLATRNTLMTCTFTLMLQAH